MAAFKRTELDLVGLARQDNQAAIQLFAIRGGKMIGRDVFLLDAVREAPDEEVLSSFLLQFYARATSIPPQVLVPLALPDAADLEAFLAARRGGPVAAGRPAARREARADGPRDAERGRDARARAGALAGRRGQDARRPRGARRGARAARRRRSGSSATTSRTSRAPTRSGAWSSSRRAGRGPGSTGGSRSGRSIGPNDFASHQEVLRRRFRRAKDGDEGAEEALRWAMPDLVIIDGGKGQVSAAKEVLDELGLHDLPLAGLAKEREELFLPGIVEPVVLPPTSSALYLVQRLRDEAHRFAITYHRDLRSKRQTRSAFDDLPGVGPEAAAGAAAGVRLGEARPRGAGRADRRGARASARPSRPGSRP